MDSKEQIVFRETKLVVYDKSTRLRLYKSMLRIRLVEEHIARYYTEQEMRCPVHLSIGQEAIASGVCAHLKPSDRVYSNHRCHAHYLAKGGDLNAMIAELYGKETGCAGGKGGSMHLIDPECGMMGASALVGGTIPIAVGSALHFSLKEGEDLSVCFFGDGATEEGLFYESLNFAVLKSLPVIFVCENNRYATYSALEARQGETNIAERVKNFGLSTVQIDGNDVEKVWQAMEQACTRARLEFGPSLLVCETARWKDHVGPDEDTHLGYRTEAELQFWKERCPIKRLKEQLLDNGEMSLSESEQWEIQIQKEIERGFELAKQAPFPKERDLMAGVYA